MACDARRVNVGTQAVPLYAPDIGSGGFSAIARNRGTGSIYVGGPGVTVADGFEVGVGDHVEIPDGEILYAIAATAQTVHVLVSGLG